MAGFSIWIGRAIALRADTSNGSASVTIEDRSGLRAGEGNRPRFLGFLGSGGRGAPPEASGRLQLLLEDPSESSGSPGAPDVSSC